MRSLHRHQCVLVLLLAVVLLIGLALAVHALGMDDHMMVMLGACVAVFALLVSVAPARSDLEENRAVVAVRVPIMPLQILLRGRYPPGEGTVLIC